MHGGRAALLACTQLILATYSLSCHADTPGWHELLRAPDLVIEESARGDDVVYLRATMTLASTRDSIAAVLLDIDKYPQWVPQISDWQTLERGADTVVMYGRTTLEWPYSDRDAVVRYSWRTQEDGVFVVEARSDNDNGPAPIDGVVRLHSVQAKWQLVPNEIEGTAITYTFNGDLGGWMPYFLQRAQWKRDTAALLRRLRERAGSADTPPAKPRP